jgi:hypothetical protein
MVPVDVAVFVALAALGTLPKRVMFLDQATPLLDCLPIGDVSGRLEYPALAGGPLALVLMD